MFSLNLDKFIRESNRIDTQYSYGQYIPGQKLGDPLYDNHLRCFLLFEQLRKLPDSCLLDLHRELTRGVEELEDQGHSEQYRKIDITIDKRPCPSPAVAVKAIHEMVLPMARNFIARDGGWDEALKIHHAMEWAHPFADGNGRVGRLFVNLIRYVCNNSGWIVQYSARNTYYNDISRYLRSEEFREVREHHGLR